VTLEDGDVTLEADDVDLRAQAHEELVLAEDGGYAVALDTTVDDALRSEGWARSLIRCLNDRRRALDLELSDRVRVVLAAGGAIAEAARTHAEWIKGEVLAVQWEVRDPADRDRLAPLDVEGETVWASVEVVGAV